MVTYLYDGSFEGLLTAVFEAYAQKEGIHRIVPKSNLQETLFERYVFVASDNNKSDRVYRAIREKISPRALRHVYNTYLSELPDAGIWILQYLQRGFKIGRNVDLHLSDPTVHNVHAASQKVMGERHRMLGLIRFKQVENELYYASFEPDHNIVALVTPHFTKRMPDQNFVIHDIKRGIGAVYNTHEWFLTEIGQELSIHLSDIEQYFQDLWKQFYKSITINERINPKLQKRCMPSRYWKHLIEKQ